jgi:hypothetical protein
MVKNNGTHEANFVVIVIEIDSIPLILYNNSVNPVNISVDGILQINITLLDFEGDFSNDTVYNINIWLDYYDAIMEFDETNNNLSVFYTYIMYDQPPITYPDLVFQSYSLDSDLLTLVVLNNGTKISSGIELLVRINSLSLTLFNGTITPFTLDVDETTLVVVNLTDFFGWFEDGEIYSINAHVDPLNYIEELSEINNQIDVDYNYQEEELTPSTPPAVPWMIEFLISITLVTTLILATKFRKYKLLQ